jgi:hypothetical protein
MRDWGTARPRSSIFVSDDIVDIKVPAEDFHADHGNRMAQPRCRDRAIKNISVASQPVPDTNALLFRK